MRIPDHFSILLPLWNRGWILGYLLAFFVQPPANFYNTWQNDLCRQENESSTFCERSGSCLYPDAD